MLLVVIIYSSGRGEGKGHQFRWVKILRNIMVVISLVCRCKLLALNRGQGRQLDLGTLVDLGKKV